jgi:hypothetical protein
MSVLPDQAKFFCVGSGMLVGIVVSVAAIALYPTPKFLDRPESYPFFDRETFTRWRQEDLDRAKLSLQDDGSSCEENGRRTLRFAVSKYYDNRAREFLLADHYLSAGEAERDKRLWETAEHQKVQQGIVEAARAGVLSRADFRPILPELAALIDKGKPVDPICD